MGRKVEKGTMKYDSSSQEAFEKGQGYVKEKKRKTDVSVG
jgi:hypothetical protein